MTQTTPSHSQAVEAAEREKFEAWWRGRDPLDCNLNRRDNGSYLFGRTQSVWNAWQASAALTRQQEVAAPVKLPEPDTNWCGNFPGDFVTFHSTDQIYEFANARVRAALAASRVPVASLASREQGVEVVRAEPEGDTLEDNVRYLLDKCPYTVRDQSGDRTGSKAKEDLAGSLAITFIGMQTELKRLKAEPAGAVPLSEQKQDQGRLAVADSGGVEPVLVQDDLLVTAVNAGATTAPEFWRGQVLGYRVEFPSLKALEDYTRTAIKDEFTAAQPTTPVPGGPVAQGEAIFQGPKKWTPDEIAQGHMGIRWINLGGVGGTPTLHDVREYIQRRGDEILCECNDCLKFITPANMAVGAGGSVGAVIGMRDGVYTDSTPLLHIGDSAFEDWFQGQPFATQNGIKQMCRDSYAAGMGDPMVTYATPAPEQATTGSGQGDAEPDHQAILGAAFKYIGAHQSMEAAMKHGVNVHGAISGIIGATDNLRAAILSTASPAGGGEVKT